MSAPSSSPVPGRRRGIQAAAIASAIALTVGASGFFMGLRATSKSTLERRQAHSLDASGATPAETPPADDGSAPVAVEYARLRETPIRPNTDWVNDLSRLAAPEPARVSFTRLSEEEQAQIRQRRVSRRQYDGAPPVSPHPIDQATPAACLQCHGRPTFISGIAVPQMSHQMHANCIQCHVSGVGPTSTWRSRPVSLGDGNRFTGKPLPGYGERAYPGAPPVIPHTTWMRENCMSCHGPTGTSALRTTHPERANCLQCHATQATADQRPSLADFSNRVPPPLPR